MNLENSTEMYGANVKATLVRELQAPTQKATTTQEIYSQETEEEQPQMEVTETAAEPEEEQETEEEQSQMEVTEADAEPEADQEEADQMRDTDERRARHQPTREQSRVDVAYQGG